MKKDLPKASAGPADDIERDIAALKPPSRARIVGRILGAITTLLLAPVLLLWLGANGLTLSGLALGALMLAILLLIVVPPPAARSMRIARLTAAGSSLFFVSSFALVRLFAEPPPQALRFADKGRRDARPPWHSRLLDERETALAGLSFSGALGLVRGREKEHLGELLREAYSTSPAPWPNAIFIESSPGYTRHLEHIPVGAKNVPCLVFLHSFGGQLTAYLRVLDRLAVRAARGMMVLARPAFSREKNLSTRPDAYRCAIEIRFTWSALALPQTRKIGSPIR